MPQNCSKDISRVIEYVDHIGKSGSENQVQKLKDLFGLGDLEHFDDFARYSFAKFFKKKV